MNKETPIELIEPSSQSMVAAFYTAVDGIIIIDSKGTIQNFNPACETLFGYGASEVVGRNIKILMPEHYAREHDQYLKNYQESGDAKIIGIGREVTGRRKNGSEFPMELSVGEITDVAASGHYVGIIRDITERRRSEEQYKSLTQNLKSVIDTAVDGIIIIDDQGLIQDFNPACETLFGYAPQEVIGQNVKVLMPEHYAREHDQYLNNYQETGDAKIIGIGREVTGRRKDGSEFPMELSVGEITDASASGHYVGIIRDITERKLAEERYKALTQSLKSVIDTAVDGIIIIDDRGVIQDFNPACVTLFGYTPDEAIGQNVKVLMPENYAREHDQYLKNYQDTGKAKIIGIGREVRGRHKNGSEFPMELSVGAIDDATISGHYVGIIRDVTERKVAEERFKTQTQHLKSVIDTAVDGIILINKRGLITDFDPACEALFGYEVKNVIGQNVKMLMPDHYAREHDQYLQNYHDTGKAKIIGIGREVTGRRKDGSEFPMELSVGEITDVTVNGDYVGVIRNITAKKEAEAVKERLINALTRSNQELDEFAYIASHDLKEPLRGLFNNAMFLEEDCGEMLDESAIARLARMRKLAERMENLIDNLLYYSRLGRQELAIMSTNLNQVIDEISSMIEGLIEEKNVVISITSPLPSIVCDRQKVTEVFRNLITNAIKYNDKKIKEIEIDFHRTFNGKNDVISVKDNGIGIDDEFHHDIFTIFKRLNVEDDSVKGYGVGLTFVKKIIDRHGGEIWLESEVGAGTTFYFTLK